MNIKKIPVGYLQANCYIINKNNANIIIDPGDEYGKIKKNIKGSVSAILITHKHFDHIGALEPLKTIFKCPVYDFSSLKEKQYQIDDFIFEVIYTPGHTYDSVSYYFKDENILFTGDFLFKESIGRTDLDTGNINDMINSIKKIKEYQNISIYPGHGDNTNLEYEKTHNVYLMQYN